MSATGKSQAGPEADPTVRDLPHRPLPVLDIGPVLAGAADAVETLASDWRAVWETLGFMCIVNHGIPQATIDEMIAEAKRFHDLPIETKMRVAVTTDQKGYIPARGGLTTHSEFHRSRKLDTVECFVAATDFPADDPRVREGRRFFGKMPWLPETELPGFRAATESYMARITDLGKCLLPVWARALDLPADYFDPLFDNAYTYFRIAKYLPEPDLDEGETGLNPHVDTGFMTFLPPANEEGLQVHDADGNWFWPDMPSGAIIVNAGQFLERWSNKRFRATPHR
ncbi:MAG: 2-oxoglutarate and iron-dependent oxygenase domain-containing protein, partial [Alphaproteobacteria bacterium]